MSTCPSTPPRKIRVETPEAPLHGITYDRERNIERKEKVKVKQKEKEGASHRGEGNQKVDPRFCPSTSSKSTSSASITFTISPPSSPISTSLPSPINKKLDVFRDNPPKSTTSDPSTGSSHMSSTKNTKFKPPPAHPNSFTSQEYTQQTTGAQSLPTPAKTPSRKRKFTLPSEEQEGLEPATRVLFPDQTQPKQKTPTSSAPIADILEEASSARACTRKKPSNISSSGRDIGRDLFGSSEVLSPRSRRSTGGGVIEIYTDSNARVPEYDPSPENPFIDHPEGSTRDLSEKSLKRARKLREKIERSREEFENTRDGREDGMVYTFRGKKLFRKFEGDNSEVLGKGIQPRVLFPSARGTRTCGLGTVQEEEDQLEAVPSREAGEAANEISEDDIDHSTTILESHEVSPEPPMHPGTVTDVKQTESLVEGEIKKVEKTTHVVEDEIFDGLENYGEEAKTTIAVEEKSDDIETQRKKRTRAPSAAPSVSSVASSNILSFGRRPRITKSVSNLSNGEGKAPALRRSKRLASTEPEPSIEIGKATIKQKLTSKRGRTHDSMLENTEKWAMEVQGGTRKRTKH